MSVKPNETTCAVSGKECIKLPSLICLCSNSPSLVIIIIIIIIINSIAIVLHTTAAATQHVESVSFLIIIIFMSDKINMKWDQVKIHHLGQQTEFRSDWSSNHLQTNWPDKKWQQLLHCSRFIAISFNVSSHLVELSFGSQPGKRDDPTLLKLTVAFFISRCHVICWPPGRLFHPVCGIENRAWCGRRWGSIRNTWPSHRSLHNFIFLGSVSLPFPPSTYLRTSRLLTLSLHPTLANCRKQRWSNTSRRCTSCWRSGHVSHPYNKTKRTAALYTRPFTGRETSFLRHRCSKLAKAIRALLIRALISGPMLLSLLKQLDEHHWGWEVIML